MVDAGNFKLQVQRMGEGRPAVVFELGAGATLESWNNILPTAASYTTVFAYNRAGRGKSELSAAPRTPKNVVEELRAVLRQAGLTPPYILVGRSLGGIYVRTFAVLHPEEVAGLIMIEPSHERQQMEFQRVFGPPPKKSTQVTNMNEREAEAAFIRDEKQPHTTGKLPNVPVVIITSMKLSPHPSPDELKAKAIWRGLHDELFSEISRGMHILTTKSGHDVDHEEPELVLNAIRWVVDTVRRDTAK